MKDISLVIMAAGIGSGMVPELNSYKRLAPWGRLLSIIPYMMH